MRSIPGGGKDTYIRKHFPGAVVASADNFFIHTNPQTGEQEYRFDPRKLGAAHGQSFRTFQNALDAGEPLVVANNTNTQVFEMEKYVMAAKKAGYDVEIIRIETPTHIAAARNIHGVPLQAVEKMAKRMAPVPSEWEVPERVVKGTD